MIRRILISMLALALLAPTVPVAARDLATLGLERSSKPFRTRLSVKEPRVLQLQPESTPVLLLEYRCDRRAGVTALIQKVQLGTGVIEDQRRIFDSDRPMVAGGPKGCVAYGMGLQEGFTESGLYSILLETVGAEAPSGDNVFVVFYWDAEAKRIDVVTRGVADEDELAVFRTTAGSFDFPAGR